MGNIKTVKDTNGSKITYTYDGLNQLTEEYDNPHSRRVLYTYDNGGNITSKKVYNVASGSLVKEYTYTYATDWKDKLVSFNGEPIVYDAIGNPTVYRGNVLTWTNARRLASFCGNTYEYGADGIRIAKTVNGVRHDYTLNGNTIIKETYGSNTIKYFYGITGITGFNYNGTDYYYRKNLQGDILAIVNSSGTIVTSYTYDAWGKILSVTGTLASTIGTINPFRYRGYYFDTETGLYYLNSRYYDPEVGRFINADDIFTATFFGSGIIHGINLFRYCFNDPINYVDYEGFWAENYDIHDKHTRDEHIHVKYRKVKYSWYRYSHNTKHDKKDKGLKDLPKKEQERLKRKGVPSDYFDEMSITESPSITITQFPIISVPQNHVHVSPNQNSASPNITTVPIESRPSFNITPSPITFPSEGFGSVTFVLGVIIVVVFIVGALFTVVCA